MFALPAALVDEAFVMYSGCPCPRAQPVPGKQKPVPQSGLRRLQNSINLQTSCTASAWDTICASRCIVPGCCVFPDVEAPICMSQVRLNCLQPLSVQQNRHQQNARTCCRCNRSAMPVSSAVRSRTEVPAYGGIPAVDCC